MRFELFRGADTAAVFRQAIAVLGDDAVVVRMATIADAPPGERIEIVASTSGAVERFRLRITPGALVSLDRTAPRRAGPMVIALVGATGAGKTTTIAKLAVHPEEFGDWRVGLLTLDTYRAGALDQLQAYATAARLPLESARDVGDVKLALQRLSHCDVVLVDTPGRGPAQKALAARTAAMLRATAPDEVHLVAPASLRFDLAQTLRAEAADLGVTHALLTKLDEVPGEAGLAELAQRLGFPVRWVTDGQNVPVDLHAGPHRIMASLGVAVDEVGVR